MGAIDRREEKLASVISEIQDRLNRGENAKAQEYLTRYPEFAPEIAPYLSCGQFFETVLATDPSPVGGRRRSHSPPEFDLSEFSIESQAEDEALGPVFHLSPVEGQAPRELVVFREAPPKPMATRIEASVAFHRRREIKGLPRLLNYDRIEKVPFVIRERFEGESLRRLLRRVVEDGGKVGIEGLDRRKTTSGPGIGESSSDRPRRLELARVLSTRRPHVDRLYRLFENWASVLAKAHEAGIVHGRISPRVLIVGSECGITGAGLGPLATGLEGSEQVPSDRRWLAPEALDPELSPLGWKGDIYGLALCLASALTLDLPFWESGPKEVAARVAREPTRILDGLSPEIDPVVRQLLERCLSRDLFERPASMAEVRKSLRRARFSRRIGKFRIPREILVLGLFALASALVWLLIRLF